jgi:acyl-coenzyme A synthetase/AMP-(fatty) acid ligase
MTTLWGALQETAARADRRPALRVGDEVWSLEELLATSEQIADWLAGEISVGPVFLSLGYSLASTACLIGAIRAGLVPVLADPVWPEAELDRAMSRCGAVVSVRDTKLALVYSGEHSNSPDGSLELTYKHHSSHRRPDPGVDFGRFTSGSTGAPRCLAFAEAAALGAARAWVEASCYSPDDEILCLATLNNGLGFNAALFPALLSGSCLTFHPGRLTRSSILRTMTKLKPTVLVAFPFVYEQLAAAPGATDATQHLRLAISSAARLTPEVKAAWKQVSADPVCDYYGLAEVGPCTFNLTEDPESVGRALSSALIRITDEHGADCEPEEIGRVRVRTESMAHDYLDRDEPRLAASLDEYGFYVTKDLGRLARDGQLILTGRVGREINIEGRKVQPGEVEDTLRELPGVRACVVMAEQLNRRITLAAYIEGEGITREDVVAHCHGRLAPYKIPQLIHVMSELPRSSTGKPSVGSLLGLGGKGASA